jgi:hypothetical protein
MEEEGIGGGDDPGVPEALPRTLQRIRAEVGPHHIDALWIFPPLRNGRRERGLVAMSLFLDEGERRRVHTVSYLAQRSGLELQVEPSFSEEGDAPPELLPRVMDGVVRRAGEDHADPRHVEIGGDAAAFDALLEEFDPALLDPEAADPEAVDPDDGVEPDAVEPEDVEPEAAGPGAVEPEAVEAETRD